MDIEADFCIGSTFAISVGKTRTPPLPLTVKHEIGIVCSYADKTGKYQDETGLTLPFVPSAEK